MEVLYKFHDKLINNTDLHFERNANQEIDWDMQLSALLGSRGIGKTTLFLQYIKQHYGTEKTALYVSMDDIYFEINRLTDIIEPFINNGGKHLFIDEVHKYNHWSKDLKFIYDKYPEIKVSFTGSSILDINKGEADLSRRAIKYEMKGLSFREFLVFHYNYVFDTLTLNQIINQHEEISEHINNEIEILPIFRKYLKYGYYPYSKESIKNFHQRLKSTLQLVIETDLPATLGIDYQSVRNIKKLLYIIGQSVPFQPNITNLSRDIGASRNSVLEFLDHLNRAQIIGLLKKEKSQSHLTKPDKIFLGDTNIAYALSKSATNIGNIRETFFFNQLSAKHEVTTPKFGDFIIDNQYVFEIGGASKTDKQIKGLPSAFLAADNIKHGAANKIPLWLFGFLH